MIGRIKAWLAALGTAILVLAGAYLRGRSAERDRQEAARTRESLDTHRRAADADVGDGDAGDDREWLRERGKR